MTLVERLALTLGLLLIPAALVADEPPRIATFRAEITPPIGSALCASSVAPLSGIDDPLWAKGVVIESEGARYVLCALDWCELCNDAHDDLRARLARAADTVPAHVAVQCLHQHNAPIVDLAAQRFAAQAGNAEDVCDREAYAEAAQRMAGAVGAAVRRLQPFDRMLLGSAPVDRIASTRRLAGPDGKMRVRYSSAPDPDLRALPEGLIDPLLRTISFAAGEKVLVRLHYYATHPQSYYGDGRASSEFPGLARDALEREEGVVQIYFTGCGGNVAAGKYNDGSKQARLDLTARMLAGLKASVAASRPAPLGPIRWRTAQLHLPLRRDAGYTTAEAEATLANTAAAPGARASAALLLSFAARIDRPIEVSSLEIGQVSILHLPGEPFVEYQLLAQQLAPERFVAVAGYGDGGPGYLCLEKSYAEGGYEPTASRVAPQAEQAINAAIRQLLGLPAAEEPSR